MTPMQLGLLGFGVDWSVDILSLIFIIISLHNQSLKYLSWCYWLHLLFKGLIFTKIVFLSIETQNYFDFVKGFSQIQLKTQNIT